MSEDSGRAEWLLQARSYMRGETGAGPADDERPDFDPQEWRAELPAMDLYGALLFQVTGQQLSVRATRGPGPHPGPVRRPPARARRTAGLDPGKLREAGLSWRKIATLRDLAERLSDGRLDQGVLSALPDDELVAELTVIPGIGPWTVRAPCSSRWSGDVVLPGDLALRKAVQAAYGWTTCPARRRCKPSPRSGGPSAASRPATCSPPPSSQPAGRESRAAGGRRAPAGRR